jgi:methyltransferase
MATLITIQRLTELWLAQRNRRWALASGAQEYGAEHYILFFLLHVGWLVGWVVEGRAVGGLTAFWPAWLGIFVCAQLLRYWCIASLGRCWNTRILVIPGQHIVQKGPYRLIKHPNYMAVAMELLAVPLVFGAVKTAVIATVCNAALLLFIRIPEEERALKLLNFQDVDKH